MGPRRCITISPEAVPPELWDPDAASVSAQRLFLPSYGTRTLHHYQPRGCSSRVMGPRRCIINSLSAERLFLPSYGTQTLHHYQPRGCSSRVMGPRRCIIISPESVPPELWDPDAASLIHYQWRGCSSRVMGPRRCISISPEAVPPELWDPDTASVSAQRLFLLSYGTGTLHQYQPRGCSSRVMGPERCIIISCSSRVMGPGHCISISPQAVPSELWDPDAASLSAQRLFLPSYGTRTLHQPRGCSFRVMGPGRCIIISPEAVPPELWDPDTASLIHYQPRSCSSRVMGPRHCISISPEAVPPELWNPDTAAVSAQRLFLPSYGTRTLHQYQPRGCSSRVMGRERCIIISCSSRVMGPGHCISISPEAVPPELWDPDAASLSAQRLFLPSNGTRTLHH